MATLWLTYAWQDNRDNDVDFVAQELVRAGVQIKLDRWNISAGRRLWDQIAAFITDSTQSDAWALYATQNSLSSEACREELAYALDRALRSRGETFPVIALFPAAVEPDLVPLSIRTRLHVSLTDPGWKERVVAAAEGRLPSVSTAEIKPFMLAQHPAPEPFRVVIEVRPRAGSWFPFMAAIPVAEKERTGMALRSGPRGRVPPFAGVVFSGGSGVSEDGQWYFEQGGEEGTPTRSYYLFFKEMPTKFAFGQPNTEGQMLFWSGQF
jgi:hypothetical protein